MAKVTSKLQVTLPKALADQFGIRPGDEIDWTAAGDVMRIVPRRTRREALALDVRLHLFDQATDRQRRRQRRKQAVRQPATRGWRREDLYQRGRAR